MKRMPMIERPDWRAQAESLGFIFHTMYGEPYWDETVAYAFTLEEIERDLEEPSQVLHEMCLAAVERVVNSEELLEKLDIPGVYWDMVRNSWKQGERSLYGRFDLVYSGNGPAKMLEYNADTPTSLYEAAYYQWIWLEDKIRSGDLSESVDQYNSIQEALIQTLSRMFAPGTHLHFSSCKDSVEDRQTVRYLEDCAAQCGLQNHFVYVEDIGIDAQGRFTDLEDHVIEAIFKLYPWEMMLRDEFGPALPKSGMRTIEPAWKAVLSNKGILPILWDMFEGHPNLLAAYFAEDPRRDRIGSSFVTKPLFSREGENIEIVHAGARLASTPGHYGDERKIVQAYHRLPVFGQDHVVIGSWIVGDKAVGIGIREDRSMVTQNLSRFVPHYIEG